MGVFRKGRTYKFKGMHTLEERREMAKEQISKHPACIPIIVEPDPSDYEAPPLDDPVFCRPESSTLAELIYSVRMRMNLPSTMSLFYTVDGSTVPLSSVFLQLKSRADDDGWLYLRYRRESVFG